MATVVLDMTRALAPLNAALVDVNRRIAVFQAGLDMVQAGVLPVADLVKECSALNSTLSEQEPL